MNEALAGYLERYLILKEQQAVIEREIKEIQGKFSEYFKAMQITEFEYGGVILKHQRRCSISYKDEIKDMLKVKGLWDVVAVADKTKIAKVVKAGLLSPEEVAPYEQQKITYAWVLERKEEHGNDE